MKYITLKDAKELMEEASDKYRFVTEISGESGRWTQTHEIVFFPEEDSDSINDDEHHSLYAFSWSEGLTEMQESTIDTEENYELPMYDDGHDDEKVDVYPVKKVIKQVVEYVEVQ